MILGIPLLDHDFTFFENEWYVEMLQGIFPLSIGNCLTCGTKLLFVEKPIVKRPDFISMTEKWQSKSDLQKSNYKITLTFNFN